MTKTLLTIEEFPGERSRVRVFWRDSRRVAHVFYSELITPNDTAADVALRLGRLAHEVWNNYRA